MAKKRRQALWYIQKRNKKMMTSRQNLRKAGFFIPHKCHVYFLIHDELSAGRHMMAVQYLLDFLGGKNDVNCRSDLFALMFRYLSSSLQVQVWQEIARYHVINFCGVSEEAQKELIARKLATPANFQCRSGRYYMGRNFLCAYCSEPIDKIFADPIICIKNPNKCQLNTLFVMAMKKFNNPHATGQLKREIELYWPNLSLVPHNITSLLSRLLVSMIVNFNDISRMANWRIFLWGLDKFHFNFVTSYTVLATFCKCMEKYTPTDICNFVLSHFPRHVLETCASQHVTSFLLHINVVGLRTKVALRQRDLELHS